MFMVRRFGGRSTADIQRDINRVMSEQQLWEQVVANAEATPQAKRQAQRSLEAVESRLEELAIEMSSSYGAPAAAAAPAEVKVKISVPPIVTPIMAPPLMMPATAVAASPAIFYGARVGPSDVKTSNALYQEKMELLGKIARSESNVKTYDVLLQEQAELEQLKQAELEKQIAQKESDIAREQEVYRNWKRDQDAEKEAPRINAEIEQLERQIEPLKRQIVKLKQRLPKGAWGFDQLYTAIPGRVAQAQQELKELRKRQETGMRQLTRLAEQRYGLTPEEA